jgi:proteasome component ECM29
VRISVQDALSNMMHAYKPIVQSDASIQEKVLALLKANIHKDNHARYVAIKYATNLFPFSNATCRYLCIIASGDFKLEIREEARNGLCIPESATAIIGSDWDMAGPLSPGSHTSESPLPSLSTLVDILDRETKVQHNTPVLPGTQYLNSLPLAVYSNALCFFRSLLIATATHTAQTFSSSIEDQHKLEGASRQKFKEHLQGESSKTGVERYIRWIEAALMAEVSDPPLLSLASSFLLEVVSLGPVSLSANYSARIDTVKSYLASRSMETRISMSHILGIVSTSDLDNKSRQAELVKLILELISSSENTAKAAFDLRHGSIAALGFTIGRCIYRHPFDYQVIISIEVFEKALVCLSNALQSQSHLIMAACHALGEIGRYGALPRGTLAGTEISAETIRDSLVLLAKSSPEVKAQEAAISALGHVSLGSPFLAEKTLEFFKTLPLVFSKNAEIQFHVGESLCAMLFGFESTHMGIYLDIPESSTNNGIFGPRPDATQTVSFLDFIITMVAPQQSAINRKAGCIWLLCMVKFCSKQKVVSERLLRIHSCFSFLLADRDGIFALH